jgi:pyridoxine/pyridoxamine 5'-phosphate oxidase
MSDHAADARRIVDSNVYMTLATADADGRPWGSPVWFAHDDYRRFLWVSKPEARHSRNLAVRPQAAVVIFDSTVAEGAAEAVYLEVDAARAAEEDEERYIGVVSRRSTAHGWPSWSVEDVRPPARLRLYVADPSAQFVLGPNDERIAVSLA